MSKPLRELQARKNTLVKEAHSLTDRAASENRDLTDEEVSAFDALRVRIDAASAAIDREAALIADEARIGIQRALGPIVTSNDPPAEPGAFRRWPLKGAYSRRAKAVPSSYATCHTGA
jgi:HK97 family phage major capsid protein